jgi:PAS domain S-box-containing protein
MATQSDRHFRNLCQDLGFTLIAIDRDLKIRFWNGQAEHQFGNSAAEMMGKCFLDIVHEQQREDVKRLFETTIKTQVAGEMEAKYIEDDGKRTTFVLIVSPIVDEAGRCVGASASMRDISERKRLSRELARSHRMAALGNMAEGVAHHFNNILGGMLTSIDYVLPSDSPRELRRTLRLLAQAIGRATRITKQLEAFAECEHEEIQKAELNLLLTEFIDRIKPQTERAGIQLATEIAEVGSGPFEAQRVMPVLESLAHNAFDSMAAGGTLTIRMQRDAEDAVITIADDGCGIPDDVLDRVFEPFFTTKGELGGGAGANIGLGLAAVHGLVAELGGAIHLSSRVGQGTMVEVRLPLHRAVEELPPSDDPSAGRGSGDRGSEIDGCG